MKLTTKADKNSFCSNARWPKNWSW